MRIKEATERDNRELLELCRLSPMDGIIAMYMEREPDFFNLVKRRGKGKVFAVSDGTTTTGCISVTFNDHYILGSPVRVGYLADLRIHPDYYGSRAAYVLMKCAHRIRTRSTMTLTALRNTRAIVMIPMPTSIRVLRRFAVTV